jgi:glycosyltransferase involved in cell wall biosynthesis
MSPDAITAAKIRCRFDAGRLRAAVRCGTRDRARALVVRLIVAAYCALLRCARAVGPRPRCAGPHGFDVLLTGSFFSRNWVAAHLLPLAASSRCARVRVVTTMALPDMDKIEQVAPSAFLAKVIGPVAARLATFACTALRDRPDVVGGFHLLVNGLAAIVLGRLCGSRSLYFCVGGKTELLDGAVWGENRLFGRLAAPEPWVERRLVEAATAASAIITMGPNAAAFLRSRGVKSPMHVVPGGVDWARFPPGRGIPDFDLVLVARLVWVKRVDRFLRAVAIASTAQPGLTAAIVGDGPLRGELHRLAGELGLDDRVTFVGHQDDVARWLQRARVFVLTSDSESLALSVMEALTAGLPAIVPDVGDLGALVHDGVNGCLVEDHTPDAFARAIVALLRDPRLHRSLADGARRTARAVRNETVTTRWNAIFESLSDTPAPSSGTAGGGGL